MIWFGFIALFLVLSLSALKPEQEIEIELFIVPFTMAVIGYFYMKLFMFDLVDEVWDGGDALIIRNNNEQDRVSLANIVNVKHSIVPNPPRITLTLRQPCRFGKAIVFTPAFRLALADIPNFLKSSLATELVERSDAARKQ